MKIAIIIFAILGCIAVVKTFVIFVINLFLYVTFEKTNYSSITRDTMLYIHNDGCVVLPTIRYSTGFSDGSWPTITISWFKWSYAIMWHVKSEHEESLYAEVRRQMNEENES